ncbi:MAG: tRNA-binding protein [Thermofilum sp. ex4484_79]|nr:MAG: tRNA-binding protein [Thermofilum sp. ex4484_79]
MDTSKDYRILYCERILDRFMNVIRYWKLPYYTLKREKVLNRAERVKSALMTIKYSFLPLDMLLKSDMLREYEDAVEEVVKVLSEERPIISDEKTKLSYAEIRYATRTLRTLRNRLMLGEKNRIEYAIDIVGVEVASVSKHPRADRLYITKAGTGEESYIVITNIRDVKKGEVRAIALLPPALIMGEVSEAMYCSNPLPPEYKGKRPPSNLIFLSEVTSQIEEVLKSTP